MKINKINNEQALLIDDSQLVKVREFMNGAEIRLTHGGYSPKIKKISADEYMVLETGEIKEFEKIQNRSECKESLRRTFKEIRYLVNANFGGLDNEFFITLTYKENMTDTERLQKDVEKFRKKMIYHYGKFEYINVVEPQERGAWHCHLLCKFQYGTRLDYNKVRELWGHGSFVNVRHLKDVTNVGAYLSAYLGDIELNEATESDWICENGTLEGMEVMTKVVDGVEKKFIKGGRLKYYPRKMRIYRKSRGIKKPTEYVMTKGEFEQKKKKVHPAMEQTFTQVIQLSDDTGNIVKTYKYENYLYAR